MPPLGLWTSVEVDDMLDSDDGRFISVRSTCRTSHIMLLKTSSRLSMRAWHCWVRDPVDVTGRGATEYRLCVKTHAVVQLARRAASPKPKDHLHVGICPGCSRVTASSSREATASSAPRCSGC